MRSDPGCGRWDAGKDDTTKVKYYRHYAAGLYYRRWSGRWYLEINPTYHFTIDGRRDSGVRVGPC
ncbi:hypothetical protein Psuf_065800 [Phytohabitans suffuscus]|uniref:Uncharacterized protein n=1 Tax=Phytohabitans suffuscus TaxID=624315 RepID=A0A6F8YT05_9ACTN|nr:hypothetical protein Psuf_065800 [Phytohabitans suffuscus]